MAPFALGNGHHFVAWSIEKFGFGIDEALDQPRAGNPIHLRSRAGNPLHQQFLSPGREM
jgi:hypothetical protein